MIRKEVTKMDIGVSTACLYPLETEKALHELAKREVKNVEIFINSVDELEGQVLVELRRIIGEYGISVKSMHPFSSPMETLFLFGDYPRRTEYLTDIYKRYFEVMEELGAKVFVLHGAILSSKVPDGRYMERYLRLYRIAKQFGVTVAQENICYCKSSSVKFIEDMIAQLGDEVRFVVDLKQARRSNVDPFRLLDIIGDKVVHMHVSDGDAGRDCLPIGKGEFDFKHLFKEMDKISYDNSMIVELYRENYKSYDELAMCAKDMQKLYDKYKTGV